MPKKVTQFFDLIIAWQFLYNIKSNYIAILLD